MGGCLSLKSYSAKVLPGREIWCSLQQMMDEPSTDSELRFYCCKKKQTTKTVTEYRFPGPNGLHDGAEDNEKLR